MVPSCRIVWSPGSRTEESIETGSTNNVSPGSRMYEGSRCLSNSFGAVVATALAVRSRSACSLQLKTWSTDTKWCT